MKKLVVLLTLTSLIACHSESKWTARCYARFLEDENKLQTKIEIREIGQKEVAALEMDEVRFNEGAMEHHQNSVVGHYYESENSSGYPSSGFEFKIKKEKNDATIQFNASPLKNFSIKENVISKSKGFTIAWEGAALVKGEDLTVTITDIEGTVAQAVVKGATAKNEANIPSAMYSGLKPGKATYFLVKTSLPTAKIKNIQADAEVGYYSKTMEVEIVE